MNADRHARVGRLLVEAARLPAAAREAWLLGACAGDVALYDEVRALLSHHDAPVVDLDRTLGDDFDTPPRIAEYTILGTLGRGGMGVVYRAEQENPRRIVALKVIRPGLADERSARRLEHEAHTLGRLHHPGIAQVYAAGTTALGHDEPPTPFFAMELIEGLPIDTYAEANELTTRERLDLIARACDAVEHAHQRQVIHRDLKPGNVLVDADGQPKVLDFGVARSTGADIRATTLRTDVGQLIGTLAYMSPEQCAADPARIDARSDVYALGVLAYEVLTGRLPNEIGQRPIHEAVRVIREEDPTPPSRVDRRLRGDVETIIFRALEKEPARRYQSAGDLAADIRRHLASEPIQARPASAIYTAARFARRHRALVAGTAAVFAVLLAGLAVALVLLARTVRAEREAQSAVLDAEATSAFLGDLLARSNPLTETGDLGMTVRELLDVAANELGERFAGRPGVEAPLRLRIGTAYRSLGLAEAALEHLTRAHEVAEALHGPRDLRTLRASVQLTHALRAAGRLDEASARGEADLAAAIEAHGTNHEIVFESRSALGRVRARQVRLDEAAELLEQCARDATRLYGADNPETLAIRQALAVVHWDGGDDDTALTEFEDVVRGFRTAQGAGSVRALTAERDIVKILIDRGSLDEADARSRDLVAACALSLGPAHPDTLRTKIARGSLLRRAGRFDDARMELEATLETARSCDDPSEDVILDVLNSLAMVYDDLGRSGEAVGVLRDVVSMRTATVGPQAPKTMAAAANLANALLALGELAEAESLLRPLVADMARVMGESHPQTLTVFSNLASVLYRRDDLDGAEPLYRYVVERERETLGTEHVGYLTSVQNYARTLTKLGRAADAAPWYEELMEAGPRAYPDGHFMIAVHQVSYAMCLADLARFDEAEPLLVAAMPRLREVLGDDHRFTRAGARQLAEVYEATGRPKNAEPYRALLGDE